MTQGGDYPLTSVNMNSHSRIPVQYILLSLKIQSELSNFPAIKFNKYFVRKISRFFCLNAESNLCLISCHLNHTDHRSPLKFSVAQWLEHPTCALPTVVDWNPICELRIFSEFSSPHTHLFISLICVFCITTHCQVG